MHLKHDALAALKKAKVELKTLRAVGVKIDRDTVQVSRWLKGKAMSAMTADHILRVLK